MRLPPRRDIIIAVVLYALNLLDCFATIVAVGSKHALEINPIMRFLMSWGIEYFILFKVVGVAIFTVILLYMPLSKKVNTVLLFFAGMYSMLAIGHALIYWNF